MFISHRRIGKRSGKHFGFTLIEILTVMAIMGIIVGLTVPASMSSIRSSRLTMGVTTLIGQINLARQVAITQNCQVEVRFYQYGDSAEGENATQPLTGKFRSIQLVKYTDTGTYVPLGKLEHLPSGVILDQGTQISSIFNLGNGIKAGSAAYGSIPKVGTNYNFIAFRFLADGSTNLYPASSSWFLTFHDAHNGDSLAALPSNYFTVQIDSANGHVKTYRP